MLRSCESTIAKGDAVSRQQELQLTQPCLGWALSWGSCSARCGLPTTAPRIYYILVWAVPVSGLFNWSKAHIGLTQATEVTTI